METFMTVVYAWLLVGALITVPLYLFAATNEKWFTQGLTKDLWWLVLIIPATIVLWPALFFGSIRRVKYDDDDMP